MSQKMIKELLKFIEDSPSCFHVIRQASKELDSMGAHRLSETERWKLQPGRLYYVVRNDSSLIAFLMPEEEMTGFQLMAAHSDSPTFKVKENGEIAVGKDFVKLNVEKYGGMLMSTWFDRPLSLAGRVFVEEEGMIVSRLVNIDRDLLVIPSLAIHMNRGVNDGYSYNPQKDLLPLLGGPEDGGALLPLLEAEADVKAEKLLGMDLFLYNRMKGSIWGAKNEFVSAPRLDDLECVCAMLKGFEKARGVHRGMICCIFDNEEVGSETRQGAASTFLGETLERICYASGGTREDYFRLLAGSFMLSADNAHSVHPNHPDKSDQSNRPHMNGGVVLKFSANQKYTTDGSSAAVFRRLCRQAKIAHQTFFNRSDMAGGSTLGNIAVTRVPIAAADIGLAQLAMHSAYETAGVQDFVDMVRLSETFFSTEV